jgi:predicted permease
VPGFQPKTSADSVANTDLVGPGYVRAIGGHLLRGRDMQPGDVEGGPKVALINEAFARRFFADRDPIGRTVALDDTTSLTIVGVVANVKDHSLTDAIEPRMYMAFAQHPGGWSGGARMIVRASGDPTPLIPQVRATLTSIDKRFRVNSVDRVTDMMRESIAQERLLARLASGFGLMALFLAAIGLYGVMTYAVTRRTAEIGLRVALGAQRGNVIGMVLKDAMTVVAAGVVVGLPSAFAAARLLQAQLHGVTAGDPVAIAVAVAVMGASAAAAALIPALRASRVAPLLSLRQE